MSQEDIQLHAFVDDQLSPQEREEFLQKMDKDPSLKRQVCELRNTKIAMQHAFSGVEQESVSQQSTIRSRENIIRALAASIVLGIGLMFGWQMTSSNDMDLLEKAIVLGEVKADATKVILHIDEGDPEHLSALLDKAEVLIEQYKSQQIQLEIIANANGLDLMRQDKSPYAQRVSNMIEEYDNIDFIACNNAIRRLQQRGEKVLLIDQVEKAPSAVKHIIKRLQEGWSYVKT